MIIGINSTNFEKAIVRIAGTVFLVFVTLFIYEAAKSIDTRIQIGFYCNIIEVNRHYSPYIVLWVGMEQTRPADAVSTYEKEMSFRLNKTELFLEEYKKLEAVAKKQYKTHNNWEAISNLINMNCFRSIRTELDYCREVRNLLSHKPKLEETFAVEPSDQMIDLLRATIRKVENPTVAKDIAITRKNVCFRRIEDEVRPAMIEMQTNAFTHIPILDNNDVVVGVFSENTLLSYLIDDEIIGIDEKTRFADLEKYLLITAHKSESFYFIPQNMLLAEIKERFDKALRKQERIGLLFMTNHGKEKEPLQGLISAWDAAGAE